jgi:hypothetical protein
MGVVLICFKIVIDNKRWNDDTRCKKSKNRRYCVTFSHKRKGAPFSSPYIIAKILILQSNDVELRTRKVPFIAMLRTRTRS